MPTLPGDHFRQWPFEALFLLRVWWATGLPTARIGAVITKYCGGARVFSKNAVVGMAHRLALAVRPRPVGLSRSSKGRRRRQARARQLVPLIFPPSGGRSCNASAFGSLVMQLTRVIDPHSIPTVIGLPTELLNRVPEPFFLAPMSYSLVPPEPTADRMKCQYPYGDPRVPGFRFCSKRSWSCEDPTKSHVYCEEHHRLCYNVVRHSRAAA